jgi:drug/metabolite transporter (DMT)-like permease
LSAGEDVRAATRKAQWQIHFCVLLWGFTAILGKLITLPALPLVVWRMAIVVAALSLVPVVWRGLRAMPARLRWAYAGIGALVGLHWLTFYGSIKLSNASIAATCIALGPVFLAFVEPLITRRKFDPRELLLGVAVVAGVALVVGGVPVGMRAGIAVGAVSAFLVAIFGSLNKRLVEHGDPLTLTALELGAGALTLAVLSPLVFAATPAFGTQLWVVPDARDAALLAVLALACTLLPFALAFVALRHMSAFAAQLAINLEPVYAIVLAVLLLDEQRELTPQFYLGVAVIVAAVLVHPRIARRPPQAAQPELLCTAESKGVAD